ncbi:MAG: FHA domain-containing protein, partial [Chloroflexota bacterium]|nr:FHA domain-containing protein [Chloroflexota bacterium]
MRKREVALGRTSDNDIMIQDAQVSRRHATIFAQEGKLYLRDEQSTNGTWLNGQRVSRATQLKIGDRIKISGIEFVVKSAAPEPRRAPMPPEGPGYPVAARQSPALPFAIIGATAMVAVVIIVIAMLLNQPRVGPPPVVSVPTLSGSQSVSQMIRASQGGSVQLPDGTRVDIPPGALAEDMQISISAVSAPQTPGGPQEIPSTVFREFGPSGTKFQKPVRVTLPYRAMDMSDALVPDALFVARWDGVQWTYAGGTVDAATKTIKAEVDTFSEYVPLKILSTQGLKDWWQEVRGKVWRKRLDEISKTYSQTLTTLAEQIHTGPYPWRVYDVAGHNNFSALGFASPNAKDNYEIIEVDKSWYDKLTPVHELPVVKRNLLLGAILGHEEAHQVNNDNDSVLLAIEALAEGLKGGLV